MPCWPAELPGLGFFFFLVRVLVVHNLLCLTPHSASLYTLQPRLLRWRLRARSQPLCILSTLQPSQANDEGLLPLCHMNTRFGISVLVGGARRFPFTFRQWLKCFRLHYLPIKNATLPHAWSDRGQTIPATPAGPVGLQLTTFHSGSPWWDFLIQGVQAVMSAIFLCFLCIFPSFMQATTVFIGNLHSTMQCQATMWSCLCVIVAQLLQISHISGDGKQALWNFNNTILYMSELQPNKSQLNAAHDVLCFLQFKFYFHCLAYQPTVSLCFMWQYKRDLLYFPKCNFISRLCAFIFMFCFSASSFKSEFLSGIQWDAVAI